MYCLKKVGLEASFTRGIKKSDLKGSEESRIEKREGLLGFGLKPKMADRENGEDESMSDSRKENCKFPFVRRVGKFFNFVKTTVRKKWMKFGKKRMNGGYEETSGLSERSKASPCRRSTELSESESTRSELSQVSESSVEHEDGESDGMQGSAVKKLCEMPRESKETENGADCELKKTEMDRAAIAPLSQIKGVRATQREVDQESEIKRSRRGSSDDTDSEATEIPSGKFKSLRDFSPGLKMSRRKRRNESQIKRSRRGPSDDTDSEATEIPSGKFKRLRDFSPGLNMSRRKRRNDEGMSDSSVKRIFAPLLKFFKLLKKRFGRCLKFGNRWMNEETSGLSEGTESNSCQICRLLSGRFVRELVSESSDLSESSESTMEIEHDGMEGSALNEIDGNSGRIRDRANTV